LGIARETGIVSYRISFPRALPSAAGGSQRRLKVAEASDDYSTIRNSG
jgi:hypothetical protein